MKTPIVDGTIKLLSIIIIYIDDFLITGPDTEHVKAAINKHFKTKDLGDAYYYLRIHITRDRQKRSL